jgi:tricorn protease
MRSRPFTARLTASLVFAVAGSALAADTVPQTKGYYRQPAIHGDTIVFVSEGDLWKVATTGGVATRLTTGTGDETNPAISPDGKTVAFMGQYEGPTEIYTMPLEGGLPTRRTFGAARMGFVGWTPDGKVMFSTREHATLPSSQLVVLSGDGARTRVPLYEADQGAYAADGKTLFFTRLPFQGSFTKRYKGGFIQQLWKFSDGDAEASPLTTDFAGTSKDAMVWSGRVYFATDRDGMMNIWSMNPSGKDLQQHTKHAEYDIASPDLGGGRIVYQHGADIWLLDLPSGKNAPVDISLASDFDQMREQWIKNPAGSISEWSLSPSGDRLALAARGQVFVAPAKQGRFVDVTKNSGTRYRRPVFLPDGKSMLAYTDQSGEVEIWKVPANGVGEATQITTDGSILRFDMLPSPDGKLVAHVDKNQKLYITNIEDKSTKQVLQNKFEVPGDLSWSPDSKWLLFSESAANANGQIKLYSIATGQLTDLTTDRFNSYSPQFTPDGKWIYFISDRHIVSSVGSPWGALAPQPYFDRKSKLYLIACKKGDRSPWRPSDELAPAKDEKKEDKQEEKKPDTKPDTKPEITGEKKDEPEKEDDKKAATKDASKEGAKDAKKDEKKVPEVVIDLDGIASRIEEVPFTNGNYFGLTITDKALFFIDAVRGTETKSNLLALPIGNEKIETKTVASDINSYELSLDRKKLVIRKKDTFSIVDANAAPAELDGKGVDLSKWRFSLTPVKEWRQMYTDAWRLLRDYFYAPNMHAVNWNKVRDKYAPLVERVRTRAELNDVFGQLSGELSTLHHFVQGGDTRGPADDVAIASLGAELVRDAAGYRVERVYDFDPDEPGAVPPLARPGVDVVAGDIIESINGVPTLAAEPAALLRGKAGQQVLLRVKPAKGGDARDVIVVPVNMGDAADMRYTEWEYTRRKIVDEQGKGELGYVHLRNMGGGEITRWTKNFFPVYHRKGLIVDVRRNTGGNIDSWILGQLIRKPWMYWASRVSDESSWNMQLAFRGHMVVLCDQFTASDGEAFAEGFRRLGLGKLIGMRTWGGEVWLSSSNRLTDNGAATAGETGVFGPDADGKNIWLIEGHGVDPDMIVDNLPHATFKGEDAQLAAAIKHLQETIAAKPLPDAKAPKWPNKSFDNNR